MLTNSCRLPLIPSFAGTSRKLAHLSWAFSIRAWRNNGSSPTIGYALQRSALSISKVLSCGCVGVGIIGIWLLRFPCWLDRCVRMCQWAHFGCPDGSCLNTAEPKARDRAGIPVTLFMPSHMCISATLFSLNPRPGRNMPCSLFVR